MGMKRSGKWRKVLSVLLALTMALSMDMPLSVRAEEDELGGVIAAVEETVEETETAAETEAVGEDVVDTYESGRLGKNNQLTWTYDDATQTLTVTGTDELKDEDDSLFKSISSAFQKIEFVDCKITGSARNLFRSLSSVTEIDLSGLDTSEITRMGYMFYNCSALTTVTFGGSFSTASATEMYGMFNGCRSLTTLDLSSFVLTNVNTMNGMFAACDNLVTLKTPAVMGTEDEELPNSFLDEYGNAYSKMSQDNEGKTLTRRATSLAKPVEVIWDGGKMKWKMDPAFSGEPHFEWEVYVIPDGYTEERKFTNGGGYYTRNKIGDYYYNDLSSHLEADGVYRFKVKYRQGDDWLWSDYSEPKHYVRPGVQLEQPVVTALDEQGSLTFTTVEHAAEYHIQLCDKKYDYTYFSSLFQVDSIDGYDSTGFGLAWADEEHTWINANVSREIRGTGGEEYYWQVRAISEDVDTYANSDYGKSNSFILQTDRGEDENGKYSAPTNVFWSGNWNMTFQHTAKTEWFDFQIYKDDVLVHETGVALGTGKAGTITYDYSWAVKQSGTYRFRVRAVPEEGDTYHKASEWADSGIREYDKPSDTIGTTTPRWDSTRPGIILFDEVPNAGRYDICLYKLNADGSLGISRSGWLPTKGKTECDMREGITDLGAGKYKVTVTAMSSNIDRWANGGEGPESDVLDTALITKGKYENPYDLQWDGDTAKWKIPETAGIYTVQYTLYRDGEEVYQDNHWPYQEDRNSYNWNWYIHESGNYTFTVQIIPESGNPFYESSDIITSPVRTYTRLPAELGTTTVTWDAARPGIFTFEPVEGAYYYFVEVFREDAEVGITHGYTYFSKAYCEDNHYSFDIDLFARYDGPGKYRVRIQALSENLDTISHGKMGELSLAYDTSGGTPVVNCTVSFDLQGHGTAIADRTVKLGEKLSKSTDPVAKGFLFEGWYRDAAYQTAWNFANDAVTTDITLFAKWTPANSITYMDGENELTSLLPIAYATGTEVTLPTPTKTGYVFAGWYEKANFSGSAVTAIAKADTGDKTFYAKWTQIQTHTITYMDGETAMTGLTPASYEEGATPSLATPTKEGYTFDGWYAAKELTGDAVTKVPEGSKADLVYYAKWTVKLKNFKVTFNTDGGSAVAEQTVEEGKTATKPAADPTKKAFIFGGWYADAACATAYDFATVLTADVTIYAKWTPEPPAVKTFTVTFDVNGGSAVTAQTIEDGKTATKPADPTKSGFTFGGWYTDAACKTVYKFETAVTADVTVYAKWTETGKDGFWVSAVEPQDYTGSAIKPAVKVYDGTELLREKTDYTVAYKNNINAGNATIEVTGKGNYTGKETVTFVIRPMDLNSDDITMSLLWEAYTGSVINPIPTVKFGSKALKNGTDFTLSYPGSGYVEADSNYPVKVTGAGNFTGDRTLTFGITKAKLISGLKVSSIKNQSYTGDPVTPEVTVKDGKKTLERGTDYELSYRDNVDAGKATVIITGMGDNYAGVKEVTFTITGTQISKAQISGVATKTYNGRPQTQENLKLTYKGETLDEEEDYTVSYSKNVEAGTATIILTGRKGFTGTKKKTFRIEAYDIGNDPDGLLGGGLADDSAVYTKGGSMPEVAMTFDGDPMRLKLDYSVSYTNNKKIASSSAKKAPTVTVNGKGNFKGKRKFTFDITKNNLNNDGTVFVTVPDVKYAKGKGKYISKPVLIDSTGKKLTAGKDYNSKIVYTLEDDTELGKKDTVPAGQTVTATITGKGCYEGTLEVTYRITEKSFGSAQITIKPQEYTGEAVTLEPGDVTVTMGGSTLTYGTDYEIVEGSYLNNTKTGKNAASVIIRGLGEYGGNKTVKFTINAKKID